MKPFGTTPQGHTAQLFSLRTSDGFGVDVTDFGATIVRLFAPDRHGELKDVVLGFESVEGYSRLPSPPYFGATIGRYGNRIAHGRFTLDGQTYQLATNNTPGGIPCHLHGGIQGFNAMLWRAEATTDTSSLKLRYVSQDGDQGYPGTLDTTVTFTVADRALRIDYAATTDRATPINLTNHSYFNLAGEGERTVLGHVVTLNASRYTPVTAGLIPVGDLAPVGGTPFDFQSPHTIGARIERPNEQLRFAGGYDHNFVIDRVSDNLVLAATVLEPLSGRELEVLTTEPGVQFYSGNFLDGTLPGKHGHAYERRSGFCLETQHYPDSPNHPAFPSTILCPGEAYRSTTVYRFQTR